MHRGGVTYRHQNLDPGFTYPAALQEWLLRNEMRASLRGDVITFSHEKKEASFQLCRAGEACHKRELPVIFDFQLHSDAERLGGMILSRLQMNKTVFARNCSYAPVGRQAALAFHEKYHLLGAAGGAYHRGLFLRQELVAAASFSKGRKMNRLHESKRSYELIRFCSRAGLTVTGGLSKLVQNFCREKNAGDVMTYVDRQYSEGDSFAAAGFTIAGELGPSDFFIDRATYRKITPEEATKQPNVIRSMNFGSIKMLYSPDKQGN